ncbi:MAG: glycosyltransferase family 4 protein [Firmicutes bacterium]|nr:glycosyltransferase family 4 protein [Bacillota bacterium]
MRVIILSSLFYPEIAANAKRMTDLAEALASRGHEVAVVAAPLHRQRGAFPAISPGAPGGREVDDHGIKIVRTFMYEPAKKTFFRRLLGVLSFALSSPFGALRLRGRYDLLVTISPSMFSGVSASIVSGLRRIPFIFDVQDIYPETAVQLGVLKNKTLIRMARWLERFIYQAAAKIVVISQGFRADITQQKGISADKVAVIPNWADTEIFRPMRGDGFKRAHGLQGKFVVMFAGNIGLAQRLRTVIEAARTLRKYTDIQFVLAGEGVEKERLVQLSGAYNLKNVTFLPGRPHVEMPALLAAADVCLVHLHKNPLGKITIPCKTYEYMAAGKPILMGASGEGKNLVEEAQCGLAFEPENPERLVEALLQLYENRGDLARLGENGRRYVAEKFSKGKVTADYIELLESMAGEPLTGDLVGKGGKQRNGDPCNRRFRSRRCAAGPGVARARS